MATFMTEHIESRHSNTQSAHTAFNSAMYRTFKEDREMYIAARAVSDGLDGAFTLEIGKGDVDLMRLRGGVGEGVAWE
jgi:hypothetical protein